MHKGTIDVYDRQAAYWASTRRGEREGDLPRAADFRALAGDGLVLDLGCGPGKLFEQLAAPLVGLDASISMLQVAPAGWPLCGGDLERLPFASDCAAGAFGNFSYQHLPRDAFSRAIAEVLRVLRPGGVLRLAMHHGDFEGDQRPGDDLPGRWFTYWMPEPLEAELERTGFAAVTVDDRGGAGPVIATARKPRE